MARARKLARLSGEQAAQLAKRYVVSTSEATISRLESLAELPTGPRSASKRFLAYVLAIGYEVDPADLELTDDDLREPTDLAGRRFRPLSHLSRQDLR